MITDLNDKERLSFNLGEVLNLNDGKTVSINHLQLFYQDQRTIKQEKTTWQVFKKSFTTSMALSSGAAAVSFISFLFFKMIKAKVERS
ncbi:hypothetical protein [Candidatus Rhabdochlamydia sp. T3358]|uniref:hypothetical protein n=1 Tax=Candidatus Rhabdochlamydia sp. T3358 TaxID=2099795 RepID=UPI0010AF1BEA|nr:hypothetical protein [Candidatus Rhabdochlamydia sp. T3358]VHO04772.1 hypothetical protein RHT_01528 [Candidatus Rhabdochlamydia sp. T3358]